MPNKDLALLEAKQDARLAQILRRVERSAQSAMQSILREIPRLDGAEQKAAALLQFRQLMDEAGYQRALAEFDNLFAEEVKAIRQRLADAGVPKERILTGQNTALIDQLLRINRQAIESRLDSLRADIEGDMLQSIMVGSEFDPVARGERTASQLDNSISTEASTLRAGFSRAVEFNIAEELGLDLFLYAGPEDDITREFCQGVFDAKDPPIYSKAEIDAMDNGQGLPVAEYGGGYNCRHRWLAISEEEARRRGWEP